jgi:hypothetical protein
MSKMNSCYQDEKQREFDEAVQERIDRAIEKIEALMNEPERWGGEGYQDACDDVLAILKGER